MAMHEKRTFFERLLYALDRQKLNQLAKNECHIETPSNHDKTALIALMVGRDNAGLRQALVDYVKNVI